MKYLAFIETVDKGSFTKAADSLNYAQSSVSKMIADLEKEWGMSLLQRNKKGVCLTSSGEQILPYARKILSDFEKMQQKVNEINGIQSGIVRIGTFSSVAINWLPDVFARFQEKYPEMILKRIPYQIAIRSFRKLYFREIALAMKDKKRLNPAAKKFIEYLKEINKGW